MSWGPRPALRPFVKIMWASDETLSPEAVRAQRELVLPTGTAVGAEEIGLICGILRMAVENGPQCAALLARCLGFDELPQIEDICVKFAATLGWVYPSLDRITDCGYACSDRLDQIRQARARGVDHPQVAERDVSDHP